MKRLLIVVFLSMQIIVAMGQKTAVEHSRVPIYLSGVVGLGQSNYYDAGVSPLRYRGFGVGAGFGLSVQWSRFEIDVDGRVVGCLSAYNDADPDAGAYGVTIDPRVTFLCRVAQPAQGKLRLWAGGTFNPYIDLRINQKVMNAAVGLTEMISLAGNFRIEYDIASRRRTDLFTLSAGLTLPLFAIGERPAYAYVYNATSSSEVLEYLIDGNEMFFMGFPGATTDIGLFYNLKNRNRIGLTYRWDYRTTRHAATHRFDNASHLINLVFLFNIH